MGKTIYVNGSIIIKSKYFYPMEIGCGYTTPPPGAEIIEPSDEFEGIRCLLIDDDHPQSLFNEYYARGEVSTDAITSSYLSASFLDSVLEYNKRLFEIINIIHRAEDWSNEERSVLYKMSFVNILTTLDSFICYTLIARAVDDEVLFSKLMKELAPKSKQDQWNNYKNSENNGAWEQDAIKLVLETSFVNTTKIDRAYKEVNIHNLKYNRDTLRKYFRMRHLIVHRSGRQINDNEIHISIDVLSDLIDECHTLVGAIFDSLTIAIKEELKNAPPLRPIEEIFPNGRVTTPFKLSDLNRLTGPIKSEISLEDIIMPSL